MQPPQPLGPCLIVRASDERLARLTERMAAVYEGFGQFNRQQIEAAIWAWLTGAVDTLLNQGDQQDFGWEMFDAALIGQTQGDRA